MFAYLKQLATEAQPINNKVSDVSKNITNRVLNTNAVQSVVKLGHKGLVVTVGVGINTATPVVEKTKSFFNWLGSEPVVVKK